MWRRPPTGFGVVASAAGDARVRPDARRSAVHPGGCARPHVSVSEPAPRRGARPSPRRSAGGANSRNCACRARRRVVAFRATLASVLSMIVAMALNLDNPYWAAITAVSIVVPDVSSSFVRSVDRCLGHFYRSGRRVFRRAVRGRATDVPARSARARSPSASTGRSVAPTDMPCCSGAVTVVLVMFGALEAPERRVQARGLPVDGDHGRGRGVLSRAGCARALRPIGPASAPSPEFSPIRPTGTCSPLPLRGGSRSPASR